MSLRRDMSLGRSCTHTIRLAPHADAGSQSNSYFPISFFQSCDPVASSYFCWARRDFFIFSNHLLSGFLHTWPYQESCVFWIFPDMLYSTYIFLLTSSFLIPSIALDSQDFSGSLSLMHSRPVSLTNLPL